MRIIRAFAPVIIMMFSAGLAYAGGGTAFTYQGQLFDAGVPANGVFDFEFELWDADVGGSQIGSTQIHNAVPITDGRLLILLDFGANAFDNADRWLEVTVDTVLLIPRQPVTRVPYAIQTRGIFVDQDQRVFVGRDTHITPAEVFGIHRDTSLFGGMYVSTSSQQGMPFYGYSAGGGVGDIDAYHYYNGSTGKWHLYNNGDRLTVQSNGNVGIGTTKPLYPLDVVTTTDVAVYGYTVSTSPAAIGVGGTASGTSAYNYGVYGSSHSSSGMGVFGYATNSTGVNYGVRGWTHSPDGYGLYSQGNCYVNGELSKSSGMFKIDHPLDPQNKYLQHSFVESPDMMNIYNGNVVTDCAGYATVQLPDWFDALNRDFRYQLTVIDDLDSDTFVLAKVVKEIKKNEFVLRTSQPNVKVSWQVTGIRQDRWAQAHRIEVEPYKRPEHQGKYLNPELYGQPKELGVHYFPHAERPVTDTTLAKAQAGPTPNPSTGGAK